MKKYTTIAVSIPVVLLENLDKKAAELNLSRSAYVTSMLSVVTMWDKSANEKKEYLNSIYGKRV